MTIYLLSGLGVDSRIFKYLCFPPGIKTVHIAWLTPYTHESLREYARRISKQIDTSQPFILVGLSFGGIVATEVLEYVQPQKTILISSVVQRKELPFYYRLAGVLKLNRLLPARAINRATFFTYWLFGIQDKKDKLLLKDILTDTSIHFARWAINEIFNWKRQTAPENLIRIHGDKDRVLPTIRFTPTYLIQNGGHFMVVNRANELSAIIRATIGST